MKLYDKVKDLLVKYPQLRDSDKRLIWAIWTVSNKTSFGSITKDSFYSANSSESITRARRKVQELNPELRPTKLVQETRHKKQQDKGTFIFREQTNLL